MGDRIIVRIVRVMWGVSQLEERVECVDKFDVGVRNMAEREERKLCSVPAQPGLQEFHCKLDLSNKKYCDTKFGFWVTAVNINHNRGLSLSPRQAWSQPVSPQVWRGSSPSPTPCWR